MKKLLLLLSILLATSAWGQEDNELNTSSAE